MLDPLHRSSNIFGTTHAHITHRLESLMGCILPTMRCRFATLLGVPFMRFKIMTLSILLGLKVCVGPNNTRYNECWRYSCSCLPLSGDMKVHAHAFVPGHTGEVFFILIWSYERKFPLIHLFLQIFITVPGVITGTFSGISQHPSKPFLLLLLFTVHMRL